jgi:hypothetical protein
MSDSKIRLVEDEEDFQLPLLGFSSHKKTTSEKTVDTMLSSSTLYTALHPSDDMVPVKRIEQPSRRPSQDMIDRNPVRIQESSRQIPRSIANRNLLGVGLQLEKCESAPGTIGGSEDLKTSDEGNLNDENGGG